LFSDSLKKEGNTPLHIACLMGNKTSSSVLMNEGADIRIKNKVK
jgi:ankyrin repeat protein